MPMLRSFWFYFNATPVAFSLLFFSINLLFKWGSDYESPAFADAVEHCKDVSNDTWADNERTYQDVCVDMFMGNEKDFMTTTSELFWVLGLLLSIVGIAFIVPLSIYLLLSWRKHRYGHY
jgi:hypothetical protein